MARHIAQISTARVPLAAGLRTAADETDSRRVASALNWIADQLDQGRSLEDTLAAFGQVVATLYQRTDSGCGTHGDLWGMRCSTWWSKSRPIGTCGGVCGRDLPTRCLSCCFPWS